MNVSSEAGIRSRSLFLTLLVHGLILLLLFFFMIRIPIPPFPDAAGGNGGVLVNIGMEESASGDDQPIAENDLAAEKNVSDQSSPETEENVATQDAENVAVATPVKKVIHKTKAVPLKEDAKAEKKPEIKIEVPVRVVNNQALYKGKNNKSNSQGTAATGSGDQGDKNGDPNSGSYGQNGNGTGPGNGTGTGPGNGPGNGDSGFRFTLTNRKIILKPSITDKSQETGTVVVEITVDKSGKVTKASPGARGTTSTSHHLQDIAKQSALTAKFNASPAAAEEQKGTITFVFTVQ